MFAKELADLLVIKEVEGSVENITVEKLAQDSRKVVPNTMFFCIEGVTVDGHQFAGKAKELGASVFVASKSIKEQVGDSPVIYVKDVTRVMTLFANHFYGYPIRIVKYDWSYRDQWENYCNAYGGLFIRRIRKTNSAHWNDVS